MCFAKKFNFQKLVLAVKVSLVNRCFIITLNQAFVAKFNSCFTFTTAESLYRKQAIKG